MVPNLSLFIAKRYFFSRKKRSFINVISLLSMIGICVGTTALIIVLSVFNGLEELNRLIFKAQNPDLLVTPLEGKSFARPTGSEWKQMQTLEGVVAALPVIEENALARNGQSQMVVKLKGVDTTYVRVSGLARSVVEGGFFLEKDSVSYAFVGGGVYGLLGVHVQDFLYPLELWYPRNQALDVLNPESNVNTVSIPVSGVFALEQQFDNYLYVPLGVAEQLTENTNKITGIELFTHPQADLTVIKKQLGRVLGKGFSIKDRDEQNAALFRAIKIEKLFIFIALLFIIGIAAFNIFFSLTMLVLDKQDDIETLSAIGATPRMVNRIFLTEGAMLAFVGGALGLLLGAAICWAQQEFGFVTMGMTNAVVDAYPVQMKLSDFLYTAIAIICITLLAAFFPARRAVAFMHLGT